MTNKNSSLPLKTPSMIFLSLQHVLVMYAGAVSIPLIVGGALGLSTAEIAFLITADLFVCGIATLIQTIGFKNVGIRLPIMMGVTFTAVGPMIAIGKNPDMGLLSIFGATIVAGIFGFLVSPFVGKLIRFFPPVVTGTQILVIGLSLIGIAGTWAAGGYGVKDFGNPLYLSIAACVLFTIIVINRYVKGFFGNISVLIGLIIGYVIAAFSGLISLDKIDDSPWLGWVMPFHFGMPEFNFWAILAMCVVMLVIFIETTGMFMAVGEVVDEEINEEKLTRGFKADSLGTMIGGIFNVFPYTSYAQNIGLLSITGVKNRSVCALAGVFLIVLGLFPKLAYFVASIPSCVLGGAALFMFGMVMSNGIKVLQRVDFENVNNLYVIAISTSIGMLPVFSPTIFSNLPASLSPLLNSPILLTAFCAVTLNVILNRKSESMKCADEQLKGA
ncbi:purine permease (plasmid) [Moraxella osloensis]|nr:nucleobase:cation symporter-2 family protein [Moraxella osloensis]ATQ86159.1 purine permease [Moraxella osloensis]